MTIEISTLKRVRFSRESTFGTEVSGWTGAESSTLYSLPCVEGSVSMTLEQDLIDPKVLVAYKDQKYESVLGLKRGKLSFSIPVTVPATVSSGSTHTVNGWMYLMHSIFGGQAQTEQHVSDTGSWGNAATYNVTTSVASWGIDEGCAVGVTMPSGLIEWRGVDQASSAQAILKYPVSTTPSVGSTHYACSTYYPTENPTYSLQFFVEDSPEASDVWILYGGQVESFEIVNGWGDIVVVNVTVSFANWNHGDSGSIMGTGYRSSSDYVAQVFGGYSYTNINSFVPNTGGQFLFYPSTWSGYSTDHLPMATAHSYQCGLSYSPVRSPNGVQSIARWVRNRSIPFVSGSFRVPFDGDPFEAETYHSYKTLKTDMGLWHVFGGTAGNTFIIDCPTVQVTNVQKVDEGGLNYVQVDWEGRHDYMIGATDGSLTSSELYRAAVRFHVG